MARRPAFLPGRRAHLFGVHDRVYYFSISLAYNINTVSQLRMHVLQLAGSLCTCMLVALLWVLYLFVAHARTTTSLHPHLLRFASEWRAVRFAHPRFARTPYSAHATFFYAKFPGSHFIGDSLHNRRNLYVETVTFWGLKQRGDQAFFGPFFHFSCTLFDLIWAPFHTFKLTRAR